MSFSTQIKDELCARGEESDCCKLSLLYGLLICSNIFDGNRIRFICENAAIARLICDLAEDCLQIKLTPEQSAEKKVTFYKVLITDRRQLDVILEAFGYTRHTLSFRMSEKVLTCKNCRKAFIKGVFLSCGTITEPSRSYHLEFVLPHMNIQRDIAALLESEFARPKQTIRKNYYILYYKDSERNEDFLAYIGAQKYAFEIMDTKILKDIRNNANRVTNCETANITKTIDASGEQISAIQKIIHAGRLDELPDEIRQTANLRLEFQEASLKEIGDMFTPPVTKSGINHRIRKIMALAESISAVGAGEHPESIPPRS